MKKAAEKPAEVSSNLGVPFHLEILQNPELKQNWLSLVQSRDEANVELAAQLIGATHVNCESFFPDGDFDRGGWRGTNFSRMWESIVGYQYAYELDFAQDEKREPEGIDWDFIEEIGTNDYWEYPIEHMIIFPNGKGLVCVHIKTLPKEISVYHVLLSISF